MSSVPIDFLYTNIGRGHPYYLDGIREILDPYRVGRVQDVFQISQGMGQFGWHIIKLFYSHGSSCAAFDSIYSYIRKNVNFSRPRFLLKAITQSLHSSYISSSNPLVVAHPLLVGILTNRRNLIYQHGEIVVPDDAIVTGEHTVLVPDGNTADRFVNSGMPKGKLVITGLCIENRLIDKADHCFLGRIKRLEGHEKLTGAFFSSGAEPYRHVELIGDAALSAFREGHRVLIFARRGGKLERCIRRLFKSVGFNLLEGNDACAINEARLCLYTNRTELDILTAYFFSKFDFFMAPAHERTNWGLGLGLPMFVVKPSIGSFAPLNLERLIREGVGKSISMEEAKIFGEVLSGVSNDGTLMRMARFGYGRYDYHGFQNIVNWLSENL